jgi:2-keto-4-pentenoate hydratase/2-oxohepta-3-ene-1,7-dioic acid hydratase in catechol pathway
MKLVTFEINGEDRLGAWVGDNIFDLHACYLLYLTGVTREKVSEIGHEALMKMEAKTCGEMPSSMIGFLKLGTQALQRAEKVLKRMSEFSSGDMPEETIYKAGDISLKAPVPWPGKILCLAGNYAEHIREGGKQVAGKDKMAPRVFMKPNTSVIGMDQPIYIPKKGNKIDWEAELAVVIGKQGKYIPQDEAYDYIAGYTIMNDVSERELIIEADREPSEWNRFFDWLNGKWMDSFAPMGPCLVTKDEIENPHNLSISLKVNHEIKQDSITGNMIFNIPELVEFTSRLMTLEPGDIISTGTPSGVGSASGTFLKPGDVVDAEIDKIGILSNPVESEL